MSDIRRRVLFDYYIRLEFYPKNSPEEIKEMIENLNDEGVNECIKICIELESKIT